jgi:hypothetical protein
MKRLLFAAIVFIGLVAATVPLPAIAQFKQEAKLVGTDAIGFSEQGYSAALSWDGNTALVGGRHDASGMLNERGAAWVFERSRGKWTQQTKLVGMGDIGNSDQGFSVALSSSGNTAIVSGPFDNHNVGAARIFQRSFDREWKQQAKLVPAARLSASNLAIPRRSLAMEIPPLSVRLVPTARSALGLYLCVGTACGTNNPNSLAPPLQVHFQPKGRQSRSQATEIPPLLAGLMTIIGRVPL